MEEDSPKSFPQQSNKRSAAEFLCIHIKKTLEEKRISVLKTNWCGTTIKVTTDKVVPEETRSAVRQFADSKGFTIDFITIPG